MAEHGGSMATWLVLHHAFEAPDSSQSHLAARLDIEAPTLVRHLDRLEADGLLERRRDPRDRRVLRVRLTAAGAGSRDPPALHRRGGERRAARRCSAPTTTIVERGLERIREYSLASLAERKHHVALRPSASKTK